MELQKERIILGIDPGTAVMGYGLVKSWYKNRADQPWRGENGKIDDHMLKLQRIFEKPLPY